MLKHVTLTAAALALSAAAWAGGGAARDLVAHGRKLVNIGGCNDCHTPGWTEHGGHAPAALLLTGDGMIWHGPWGTTYPTNLRLFVRRFSAAGWIKTVRTVKARPPMPTWAFRDMSDRDLEAIFYYIRSLGPAGKPVPADLPPGEKPMPPYVELVLPQPPPRNELAH